MRSAILGFVVMFVICGAQQESRASNTVSTKVILALQPSWFELEDYFTDEANKAMIDSGHVYLANVKALYLGYKYSTMEYIKGWLESADAYGVLEYGGHGSSNGNTGGEGFVLETDAYAEMNRLINAGIFATDELDVGLNRAGTLYLIMMRPAYTSNHPSGCSVAFISTCYGTVAGNFNASCKVAGVGEADNLGLMGSFSCLMSWLVSPRRRILDFAAAKGIQCIEPATGSGQYELSASFGYGRRNEYETMGCIPICSACLVHYGERCSVAQEKNLGVGADLYRPGGVQSSGCS